ncbi:MAG TPA: hypothetical protein P5227_04545 [Emcibacteraceae bacterium]|nr:hypothetical protein [Emcibacteraceae bacterium]
MDSNIARILTEAIKAEHKDITKNIDKVQESNHDHTYLLEDIIDNLSGPALVTDESLNVLEKIFMPKVWYLLFKTEIRLYMV